MKLQYLLDTNICIYLMDERPPSVIKKFAKYKQGQVAISAVTWAELCCGLDTHNDASEMALLHEKLSPQPFDAAAAAVFGQLSQQFPKKKASFDRMIAAHAISLKVALVTNNTADFLIYQAAGLRLENWAELA